MAPRRSGRASATPQPKAKADDELEDYTPEADSEGEEEEEEDPSSEEETEVDEEEEDSDEDSDDYEDEDDEEMVRCSRQEEGESVRTDWRQLRPPRGGAPPFYAKVGGGVHGTCARGCHQGPRWR